MKVFTHLVVAALLFVTVPQSPERPVSHLGEFQLLTLTVSTSKPKYAEFEPIPVTLTLKNETDKPLMGHRVLVFGSPYVQLFVDRGNGPERIRSLSSLIIDIWADRHEFQPAEEIKSTEQLALNLNEAFPKPGTYQLLARVNAADGTAAITSKPVTVEIVEPQGVDADALNYLRAQSNPAYFFTGMKAVKDPQQEKTLEEFVAQYGESAYGDAAMLTLGYLRFAQRRYEDARVIFKQLATKPGYPMAAEAAKYLRMSVLRTQRQ